MTGSPAYALALALAALVACDKGRVFTTVCLLPRASRAVKRNKYKKAEDMKKSDTKENLRLALSIS